MVLCKSPDTFKELNLRMLGTFVWVVQSGEYFTDGGTVEPLLMATSPQQPLFLADSPYIDSCFDPLYNGQFFWRTVHTLTLVLTSLQRPLSSVAKVAVVD